VVKVNPPKPAYLLPAPVVEEPRYVAPVVVPTFKIPIPSYAAPLEEPVSTYLPPQEIVEPKDDGYHYDPPAEPFLF